MSTELAFYELGAGRFSEPLERAAIRFEIVEPLWKAHWAAQIAHESAGFRAVVENMNYSAEALLRTWPARFTEETARSMARQPERIANHVYGGRMGNVAPGDGWRFRGRGLIQLTGRENYGRASRGIYGDDRLLASPELLEQPDGAALSAGWYWQSRNLNHLAERDDIVAITRAVNGGLHGLDDRRRWLARAKVAFMVRGA